MHSLVIGWRRLLREKLYAFVCVGSLAIGITGSILISLYLVSELSFDHYHVNRDRIYRLSTELSGTEIAGSGYEMGPLIVNNYPQYLDYVRFRSAFENEFQFGDVSNSWEDVLLADPSVFDVFTIVPVSGDPITALAEPYSIALSETIAQYYFPDRDPIGQTLSTDQFDFRVTMVFEDLPENVSFGINALLPFQLVEIYRPELFDPDDRSSFGDRFISNFFTYLYVANDFDPASITAVSESLFDSHIVSGFGSATGGFADMYLMHHLQKLSDIHFSRALLGDDPPGNIVNIYVFSGVMIALLLSSCVNYVNLATARATIRTKEVVIKKLLGANAKSLIAQFLMESLLLVGLAFLLGLGLSLLIMQLGILENLTGKAELGDLLGDPAVLGMLVLAWLGIGLLSGFYPAWKLAQPPLTAIFGASNPVRRRLIPVRELLVWVQMSVAIVIVAWVLMMLRQSEYLLNAPLGFEKQDRFVIRLQGADEIRNRDALLSELRQQPGIVNAAATQSSIGRSVSISIMPVETNEGDMENFTMNSYNAGPGYLETLGIELVTGDIERFFDTGDESWKLLVNETFVREREWKEPIGKKVGDTGEVVGVVRDFHYLPLQQPINPLYLRAFNDGYLNVLPADRMDTVGIDLIVQVEEAGAEDIRTTIQDTVARYSNQPIIEAESLEEIWNENYDDEQRTIGLVTIFASLSVVISLLGLAGMAAYNNERRAKEIAIRKVLGASVTDLQTLLSMSSIKILLLASPLAFGGAWYLTSLWLQRFTYRVEPSGVSLVLALLLVGLSSALVLILQTWTITNSNPVYKLKYE